MTPTRGYVMSNHSSLRLNSGATPLRLEKCSESLLAVLIWILDPLYMSLLIADSNTIFKGHFLKLHHKPILGQWTLYVSLSSCSYILQQSHYKMDHFYRRTLRHEFELILKDRQTTPRLYLDHPLLNFHN